LAFAPYAELDSAGSLVRLIFIVLFATIGRIRHLFIPPRRKISDRKAETSTPASSPHRGIYEDMYLTKLWTTTPVRRFRQRRNGATLPLLAQGTTGLSSRSTFPLNGVDSDHPLAAGEGTHRCHV
jgi:hypothetical protein